MNLSLNYPKNQSSVLVIHWDLNAWSDFNPKSIIDHECFLLQNELRTLLLECMPSPVCFQHSLKIEKLCYSTQCHLLFICDITWWYIKQRGEINQLKELKKTRAIHTHYLHKVFHNRFHSFICIVFIKYVLKFQTLHYLNGHAILPAEIGVAFTCKWGALYLLTPHS